MSEGRSEIQPLDWRAIRKRDNAIKAIETAMRRVMDLEGGNLDHPSLDFLEAARTFVELVARGDDWHDRDCGVAGGWPHRASVHIDAKNCPTCGWGGNRRLTTPGRARSGAGCDDIWHSPSNASVNAAHIGSTEAPS